MFEKFQDTKNLQFQRIQKKNLEQNSSRSATFKKCSNPPESP